MTSVQQPEPRTLPVPALKRVGHKGADHVAPGNTRESFEAALEHGVDMIEFDVLRLRDMRVEVSQVHEPSVRHAADAVHPLVHPATESVRERAGRTREFAEEGGALHPFWRADAREAMTLAMAAASLVIHQLGTTGTASPEQISRLLGVGPD